MNEMSRGGIVRVCKMRRDGLADRQTGLHPEHRGTLVSFKWEPRSIDWKGCSLAWRRQQEKFNSLCGVSAGLGFNRRGLMRYKASSADSRWATHNIGQLLPTYYWVIPLVVTCYTHLLPLNCRCFSLSALFILTELNKTMWVQLGQLCSHHRDKNLVAKCRRFIIVIHC